MYRRGRNMHCTHNYRHAHNDPTATITIHEGPTYNAIQSTATNTHNQDVMISMQEDL